MSTDLISEHMETSKFLRRFDPVALPFGSKCFLFVQHFTRRGAVWGESHRHVASKLPVPPPWVHCAGPPRFRRRSPGVAAPGRERLRLPHSRLPPPLAVPVSCYLLRTVPRVTLERRLGREPGPRSARPQACRERFLHVRGKPEAEAQDRQAADREHTQILTKPKHKTSSRPAQARAT